MRLPSGVFADIAPKIVAGWRARVAVESPSHLRDHPGEVTLTLLAAYLYCREREITDAPGRAADRDRAPDQRPRRDQGDQRVRREIRSG